MTNNVLKQHTCRHNTQVQLELQFFSLVAGTKTNKSKNFVASVAMNNSPVMNNKQPKNTLADKARKSNWRCRSFH